MPYTNEAIQNQLELLESAEQCETSQQGDRLMRGMRNIFDLPILRAHRQMEDGMARLRATEGAAADLTQIGYGWRYIYETRPVPLGADQPLAVRITQTDNETTPTMAGRSMRIEVGTWASEQPDEFEPLGKVELVFGFTRSDWHGPVDNPCTNSFYNHNDRTLSTKSFVAGGLESAGEILAERNRVIEAAAVMMDYVLIGNGVELSQVDEQELWYAAHYICGRESAESPAAVASASTA